MRIQRFASLCFYRKKLQIVLLNREGTGVQVASVLDLPDGAVANFRVIRTDILASLLIEAWKQLGIEERYVGITIPEFSTFSKTISLPLLPKDELDEAVRWQAKEFSPGGGNDVVMDWKIVRKERNTYQILVVAIAEPILTGYVSAVSEAGLHPLVVETPSLSLERLVRKANEDIGKLIIYTNFGEAVLACVRGMEIIGSAVVPSIQPEYIAATAAQMTVHYKDTPVQKIFLGGVEFTEAHITAIKRLGQPVEWLNPGVESITPLDAQSFLIPISNQRKEPLPPKDDRTVNLLPPNLVTLYENLRFYRQVWMAVIVLSFVIWGSFITATASLIVSQSEIAAMKRSVEVPGISKQVETRVHEINALSAMILKILSASHDPMTIRTQVQQARPDGVEITEEQVNLDTGSILVKGLAKDRSSLLEFKQKLEQVDDFADVFVPLTYLTQSESIPFSIELTYKNAKPVPAVKIKI